MGGGALLLRPVLQGLRPLPLAGGRRVRGGVAGARRRAPRAELGGGERCARLELGAPADGLAGSPRARLPAHPSARPGRRVDILASSCCSPARSCDGRLDRDCDPRDRQRFVDTTRMVRRLRKPEPQARSARPRAPAVIEDELDAASALRHPSPRRGADRARHTRRGGSHAGTRRTAAGRERDDAAEEPAALDADAEEEDEQIAGVAHADAARASEDRAHPAGPAAGLGDRRPGLRASYPSPRRLRRARAPSRRARTPPGRSARPPTWWRRSGTSACRRR